MRHELELTRSPLPHQGGDLFITDGGIETTMIFHEGEELPYFAAFDLLKSEAGRNKLRTYFEGYARIAVENGVGFVLESPTWRANADWAAKLGYDATTLAEANRDAIALLRPIRAAVSSSGVPCLISGCIGPRDDGYNPSILMDAVDAQAYHGSQIRTVTEAGADMVTALTMTYPQEAIGIVRAAVDIGVPVVIAFTVETDGRLPNGQTIGEAIADVDRATDKAAAYFMINCAHPTHFDHAVRAGEAWIDRIGGIRANASTMSHAELDEAEELDDGDPHDLGRRYGELQRLLPALRVVGGCCGTDHRHITAMCTACTATG